jgi:hypothetical protein
LPARTRLSCVNWAWCLRYVRTGTGTTPIGFCATVYECMFVFTVTNESLF